MIENILQMLEIAKREKQIGELTHIALGKNKLPVTFKEGYKILKLELCQL
tara:strand:- start:1654 stop:1803 length:150 start_codon:yes stop_codon:yes gene_type:complete